jgi:ABC-type polysaccharide/polyol phosphate transport system ATPase subunit
VSDAAGTSPAFDAPPDAVPVHDSPPLIQADDPPDTQPHARGVDVHEQGPDDAQEADDGADAPAEEAPYVAVEPDPDAAIIVEDLGVVYSLKLNRKQTIRDTITRRAKREGDADFWALRHVTFSVANGESLGVIGPNGAGKSTLLQVLAGILTPSEGNVSVDGHISSLLTLGVGFDQDLSGVDNIRLAGAFMGMPHRDVEERLDAIVEYAELGQFIDAPIKTYSSGMRARLGFAIATSVDPDILLLDEVLATGDAAFREKSKQRVLELVGGAKAIVLVTHDMSWVQEYCTRAMLIEQGRIVKMGSPEEVVAIHRDHMARRRAQAKEKGVFAKKRG